MDIFDRLGGFIEDILDRDGPTDSRRSADPDFASAWDELDAYLNDGGDERPVLKRTATSVPTWLHRDFRNLEVPPGTPLSEVKKAYKRLLVAFHPDRHAAPDKQQTATLVTQKLNESYRRIRDYYAANGSNGAS
ncbi:MAG: J domain-containing protein [Spirochaetaceae bacterium]|nr:MAG: J domain-containing protein [Spirochaetaceae bacterium]